MALGLLRIEHFFGQLGRELKAAGKALAHAVDSGAVATIAKDVEIATGISAFIPGFGPIAMVIQQCEQAAFGLFCKTVHDAQSLIKDNGDGTMTLSVTAEKAVIEDFKAILPTLLQAAKNQGTSLAGLQTVALPPGAYSAVPSIIVPSK